VPEGLKVVRGILAVGPYAGGDSREFHKEVWYREFMHLHGFEAGCLFPGCRPLLLPFSC
jgi:hypothetical protein